MIKLNDCPSCNHTDFKTYISCKDHTVSKEKFNLDRCQSCKLIFTNPRPEENKLGEYYKSEDYISHTNSKKGIFNYLYQFVRKLTIKQKVNMLGNKKGLLLEIGSGTGDLLAACIRDRWVGVGVEPSLEARKIASENHQIKLIENIDNINLKPNSVDCIMMWHVLEHIPNLKETLNLLKGYLKNEGKIIIAVPNSASYDAKHYKENWAAYDVPRHLTHFQKESMKKLVTSQGLKVVNQKPMLFDSFYVSMLSEKIKTGNIKFIKGTLIGLLSNLSALLINKEYSSIIYTIKAEKAK